MAVPLVTFVLYMTLLIWADGSEDVGFYLEHRFDRAERQFVIGVLVLVVAVFLNSVALFRASRDPAFAAAATALHGIALLGYGIASIIADLHASAVSLAIAVVGLVHAALTHRFRSMVSGGGDRQR